MNHLLRRFGSVTGLRFGFAGVTTLVVLVTWFGIVGIRQRISDIERIASAHQSLLEQEQSLHDNSVKLDQDILALERTIQSLREKLPDNADETHFLQELSQRATAVGVSLGEFRPGGVSQRKNCKEIELQLRGTGTYASVARWLHSLREIPRILRLSDLSISAPSQPGGDCSIDIRIGLMFGLSQEQIIASKVKS
jgi:Tfp pilus assembly protein PilO